MRNLLAGLVAVLVVATLAWAAVDWTELPTATTLVGDELIMVYQNNQVKASTTSQVGGTLDTVIFLDFDTNPSVPAHTEGRLHWDVDDKTLTIDTEVSGTHIQIGQESVVRATNITGVQIDDGSVVYVNGVQGNRPTIALADADVEGTSYALGVVTNNITNNSTGYVTTQGIVRGYDTRNFTAGNPLYVSSTAGELTATRPAAPAHGNFVGWALNKTENGSILVNPGTGYEITELHDVSDSMSPSQYAEVLMWDGDASWVASGDEGYTRHVQIPVSEIGNPSAIPDKGNIGGTTGCYLFDGGTSSENVYLQFEVPADWDGGNMILEVDLAPMVAMTDGQTIVFDATWRSIAEGEVLTQGSAATGSATYTSSGATAQYYFKHPQITIAYNNANQPLTVQDHVFVNITRSNSDTFNSDVCVTEFELVYTSIALPAY